MSRAFIKDRDDAPEPLIESHRPGTPIQITAAGRAELEERLTRTNGAAERERLARRIDDLVIVDPPADRGVVAFGATVDVRARELGSRRFRVVGAQEADVRSGRVSDGSPLGAALLGARVGQIVNWHRPAGDVALSVEAILYDDDASEGRKPA